MLAGVCAGLAGHFGWDVNLVRRAFGVFTVFYGLGALLYAPAWLILAAVGEPSSIRQSVVGRQRR